MSQFHKPPLLISACLLGVPCRYDGASKPIIEIDQLTARYTLIPVCPEQLGGLPTPRVPSERQAGLVITRDGRDVTESCLRGAQEALRIARITGCTTALLKAKSPSCGCGRIYDGSHTGVLTDGDGTTTELLKANGINVYTETGMDPLL